jgi:hypothetical protein
VYASVSFFVGVAFLLLSASDSYTVLIARARVSVRMQVRGRVRVGGWVRECVCACECACACECECACVCVRVRVRISKRYLLMLSASSCWYCSYVTYCECFLGCLPRVCIYARVSYVSSVECRLLNASVSYCICVWFAFVREFFMLVSLSCYYLLRVFRT